MCGIGGILHFNNQPVEEMAIRRMAEAMRHRGPDAEGIYIDHELGLAHRRLSIIDLSTASNQPFIDASGRYGIVFNGEIYNYSEVKSQIPDYPFRTNGDTEVILAAYIKWGAESLARLRGMFTMAIWDKQERLLFIARDRLGVKPLYYYQDADQFVFASEIRAILTLRNIKRNLDHTAIAEYFRYQSVPFPFSPVKGIRQVEAGTWIQIKSGCIKKQVYWDPTARHYEFRITEKKEVQKKVHELMLQSVKRRLVSDVPVAAFLSGGIDSSAVVGLMAEAGNNAPNTFTISFDESAFDESRFAGIIAKKFNTHHTEIRLQPETLLDELTNALDAMDSPSGDGINTYVVAKAIHRQGIRVALSGIGGDELFVGYPIFLNYIQLIRKRWIWEIPVKLRVMAGTFLGKGEKKDRMRQMLKLPSPEIAETYPVFRQIVPPSLLKRLTRLNGPDPELLSNQLLKRSQALSALPFYSQVTAAEYIGYTQQTLLKDTDQMSMAYSLEIREPFFDQDLVEFVMSVPDHFKMPVYPKSLLVESLKPMLPDQIVHRKKHGFVFPWKKWIKNELCSFCDLQINRIAERDFIHSDQLKFAWRSFLKGDPNIRWLEIWSFVVLNYWMEKNNIA